MLREFTVIKNVVIVSLSSGIPGESFIEFEKIDHAAPRCIIPFGVEAVVDAGNQIIRFTA